MVSTTTTMMLLSSPPPPMSSAAGGDEPIHSSPPPSSFATTTTTTAAAAAAADAEEVSDDDGNSGLVVVEIAAAAAAMIPQPPPQHSNETAVVVNNNTSSNSCCSLTESVSITTAAATILSTAAAAAVIEAPTTSSKRQQLPSPSSSRVEPGNNNYSNYNNNYSTDHDFNGGGDAVTVVESSLSRATEPPTITNDAVDWTEKPQHQQQQQQTAVVVVVVTPDCQAPAPAQRQQQQSIGEECQYQKSNSSKTAITTTSTATTVVPPNLHSLPIDALHSIASFLTLSDVCLNLGRISRLIHAQCRTILQRVYMHAYKCLCELIVTMKYHQQYEDGMELMALYVQNGIPMYPWSFGHAFHTMYWKMTIEIQQAAAAAANVTTPPPMPEGETTTTNHNNNTSSSSSTVDLFYGNARIHHRMGRQYTYLEEKCHFYRTTTTADVDGNQQQRHNIDNNNDTTTTTNNNNNNIIINDDAINNHSNHNTANSSTNSNTSSTNMSKVPVVVLVHQHLYDRHMIYHEHYVDIQNGTMTTPSISLSADFFHPTTTMTPIPSIGRKSNNKNNRHTATPKQRQQQQQSDPTTLASDRIINDEIVASRCNHHDVISSAAMLENGTISPTSQHEYLVENQDDTTMQINGNSNQPSTNARIEASLLPVPVVVAVNNINADDTLAPSIVTAERNNNLLTPTRTASNVSSCNIEVYSFASMMSDTTNPKLQELRKHLLSRFSTYQRRLEAFLVKGDVYAYEECILDIWDEFFPHTAGIHYYDLETPVPRISNMHKFLTKPCPKSIGTIQCEIERIKVTTRGKGVKGRLFPTYEYRLFIRHRPTLTNNNNNNIETTTTLVEAEEADDVNNSNDMSNGRSNDNTNFVRRDTVLMVAKNRGRKHTEQNGGLVPFSSTTKKGSNNYYLYMAQQTDVDDHFRNCNHHLIDGKKYASKSKLEPNGASRYPAMLSTSSSSLDNHNCIDYCHMNMILGRLQSNFIGTEFQIYIPRIQKLPRSRMDHNNGNNIMSPPIFHSDEEIDYDSGNHSDNNNNITSNTNIRRSRFGRFRRSAFAASGGTSTGTGNSGLNSGLVVGSTTMTTNQYFHSTNSDSGSVITTMTSPNLEHRTMKRTLSSPDNLQSQHSNGQQRHHSRISRRAIANDNNSPPTSSSLHPSASSTLLLEEEAGVITYTANLLGSRPRIMDVCVPRVTPDGVVGSEWKQYLEACIAEDDTIDDGCRMLSSFRQLQNRRDTNPPDQQQQQLQPNPPAPPQIGHNNTNNSNNDAQVGNNPDTEVDVDSNINNINSAESDFGLLALQNRPPWWNVELGSFVLNFGGRVSVASVKNFQLCERNGNDPDTIMLQFGRIHGRHSFTMDYSHPLTAVQAFSIAISSLQSKISFG